MIRKSKTKKVDAIFVGDMHLREDHPPCRTDDFWSKQWLKVDKISELQKEYDCPVVCSGDLFDFWKPSPMLLSKTMLHIPKKFMTNLGNHDLPQHSLELIHKCGTYCLEQANKLTIIDGTHWGQEDKHHITIAGRKILVWHVMVYQGKIPYPGCTAPKSAGMLRKHPEYDVILTGHNHIPFEEEHDGKILINPGSLTRQTAKELHKPRVYLYHAADNSFTKVYLPINADDITREHIEKVQERDDRIDAFVDTLDTDWEAETSFEDNLEKFYETNDTLTPVKTIIYQSLEDEKK